MNDIEGQINRLSGQQNYMNQLEQVVGKIDQIDYDMYHAAIDKCAPCDNNLRILSNRFLKVECMNEDGKQLFTNFIRTQDEFNIATKTFALEERKSKKSGKEKAPREIITFNHRPMEIFKSPWFKCVRAIEKSTREYLKVIFGKGDYANLTYTPDMFVKHLETNPVKESVSTYFEIPITIKDAAMFMNIANAYKCSKIIINTFMNPMYDIRARIHKNPGIISKVFRSKPLQATAGEALSSPEDIVDILEQFIVAKYRATISGNNKHFIKLFSSLVDPSSSTKIEGTKFLDIMDNLNLEDLDKSSATFKFANASKDLIKKVVTSGELDGVEIAEKITEILNTKPDAAEVIHAPELTKEFDDML